ncbi:MAG TPA: anaerobic ribonucleoside-triphosphate reductase [Oscillospiraceae bacterium]|nr:anaerobic ribonucleoside-triphosphate reductase [Oscillospiraceae bacterium]
MSENITVVGGEISQKEIDAYVHHVEQKNPSQQLKSLKIEIDGNFVNLTYDFEPIPFERIRRITGYLVGTTSRWNNAKQGELRDRVKHGLSAE